MRFWPALRLFFILGAVLWQPAVAAETVTLQLKWKHGFQFAGYYMAKELGYYDEAGLTVDIREAAPGQDVVAEVVAGRVQEDELSRRAVHDASHRVPRGLGHGRHDGDLLSAEGVDEGRLARRGAADDGDES